MNAKLIEAAIGMLAKSVPADSWAQIVGGVNQIAALIKNVDDRLGRIETKLTAMETLTARVEFLENIVRNSVDGAPAMFAERELYMTPGTIEKALAPAQNGQIDDERSQTG